MVMISVKDKNWGTLAHESTHLLERILGGDDKSHQPYVGVAKSGIDSVNLMVEGTRTVRAAARTVTDSRRLTLDQQGRMDGAATTNPKLLAD
jgi:hypothetical protein